MGLFDAFKKSIREEDPSDWIPDLDFGDDPAQRAYLKMMAKDTVINFASRAMSTVEIDITNKDGTKPACADDWEYILNVKPNKDQAASDFWQTFFYRLIDENDVLVIKTDDDQLLIAEDFTRTEWAVYEDTFSNVLYKGHIFTRTFKRSEVIFLPYNNEELERWTNGLFKDYGELFGRILEVAMRNNQIRGSVEIVQTGSFNEKKDENGKTRSQKLQAYVDKIYHTFKTKSVAIVAKTKGMSYEEYTNKQGVSNQSLDELNKMKSSLINDVANMVGIPTALIYGEKSELKENIVAFQKFFAKQLIKKLKDELNMILLDKKEYMAGDRVEVRGVIDKDPLELAEAIEKLISSSVFTGNMVLQMLGYPRSEDPEMDKRVMTKNLEKLKGGETSAET